MEKLQKLFLTFFVLAGSIGLLFAQDACKTWNSLPNQEEVMGFHSIYRPYVKGKQAAELAGMEGPSFKIAFDNWKKCYESAPAADGQRPTHYSDGRLSTKRWHKTRRTKPRKMSTMI